MYGTVARMRAKPGLLAATSSPLITAPMSRSWSRYSRTKTLTSPTPRTRSRTSGIQQFRAHLEADPDWTDGEIVEA